MPNYYHIIIWIWSICRIRYTLPRPDLDLTQRKLNPTLNQISIWKNVY